MRTSLSSVYTHSCRRARHDPEDTASMPYRLELEGDDGAVVKTWNLIPGK